MNLILNAAVEGMTTSNKNSMAAPATPSRGAANVSVIRQRQGAGGFNPMHTHNVEEVMVLMTGSVTVTQDAEWLIISRAGVQFFREDGEEVTPPWAR